MLIFLCTTLFFWCITLFFCTLHLLSHIITSATGWPSNPNIRLSVCHRHPASPQPHVIINLSPCTWFSGTISQRAHVQCDHTLPLCHPHCWQCRHAHRRHQ